ncbi:hypothetical protein CC1G_00771 [Coprinopsis cinerea okayama7|uniref:Uncharacterized protein n=1 Tax=Coprinopsis cinerea (strain Okayama-7 / 130 / ATCC MYA-4618 / FGSC 9003) TaxID=240176 RepID=A8N8P6_COPC7|nr:hypothetical protein CC1G_00771 [Coprinopsis cinerea okayama7\|eukprot:XP_001831224.2 hypothetical protein CC1G_00771 [Coprinopsis cinerea okayama7\
MSAEPQLAAGDAPSVEEPKLNTEAKPGENGAAHPDEPALDEKEKEEEQEQDGEGDDGEDSDAYDFEEEQQAPEGEDDPYGDVEEEDDQYEPAQPNGNKDSLTALLLGDPTVEEVEHDADYEDAGDYEDEEEDEDDDEDYVEPVTPTTAKKRSLDEALEEAASPREENDSKKVKA